MQRFLNSVMAIVVSLSVFGVLDTCRAQQMIFPGEEWETVSPESQYVHSDLLQDAVDFLDSTHSQGAADELVIVRNGRMIWEGPATHNLHNIFSATKSFSSTTLGLAIDDGFVTLDTLAQEHVPSMATDYPAVTLRHLATHTSGYRAAEEPYPLQPREYDFQDPATPGEPLFPPGAYFYYSPYTGMDQMLNILTRATGEGMKDYLQRRLGDAVGLDPTSWHWDDYVAPDATIVNTGGGGMHMSARDAARFGHLFLNRGNWDGEQLISEEWAEQSTQVQVPLSISNERNSISSGSGIYGYGWWVNDQTSWGGGARLFPEAPHSTYLAWGYKDNMMFVVPDWDMVVVRFAEPDLTTGIGTWSNFLGLIGSALFEDDGSPAVRPIHTYVVKDTDSDPAFDDLGDASTGQMSRVRAGIGETDSQTNNATTRLITKFGLPGGSDARRTVQSATLRFFLEDIIGTPSGPVSLWHSVTDNDSEQLPSSYEDSSYTDSLLDLVHPMDVGQRYYELDVTDLVLADYAGDGNNPMIAFRLQVNEAVFFEDDQSHRYRFTMPGAGANPPELVLTFIPEPSNLLLATLGLLTLLTLARRRSAA